MSFLKLEIREQRADGHLPWPMQGGPTSHREPPPYLLPLLQGDPRARGFQEVSPIPGSGKGSQWFCEIPRTYTEGRSFFKGTFWCLHPSESEGAVCEIGCPGCRRQDRVPEPRSGCPDHFGVGARCGQQLRQAHHVLICPQGRRRIL